MDEIWQRVSENFMGRLTGPMHLRVLLQPLMATLFALMAGMADARKGKPPYFWAMFTDPGHRVDMLRDGWKDIGKIFVLAIVLDAVYQFIVARFVYPGEALAVALLLAIVPYLVVRGLVTRLARLGGPKTPG
ncbi:MAG: hypothetical protein KA187_00125 [Arenimonas sp.]|nr:hypothetical protein [Arenimonas sp.]MBP6625800.1 hypothetical protein [Arenimonas sp.]